MTGNHSNDGESDEPGQAPAGTGCSGRTSRRLSADRHRTVKAKKSRGRKRSPKRKNGKPPGRNVPNGVTEAKRVLRNEGYIVGTVDDPDIPFDLIAHRGREILHLRVVRPREPVMNAADVKEYHSQEVIGMQPYWNSDADNIQFWLFSRVAGLLRYRVFRGGIWNVETMQKGWQEKRAGKADQESAKEGSAVQKSRTAPFPVHATGDE